MRIACLLVFLTLLGFAQPSASGQENPAAIKPLAIGDTVPDVVLENIINYPSSSARLSHFKGKLLILDFWATYCAPCVRSFPHLDLLNTLYKENLQVLLVNPKGTGDTGARISAFLSSLKKKNSSFSLPILICDTVLQKLFPFRLLPHYVWIRNNKVIAITGSGSVNNQSVSAALKGLPPSATVKRDILNFDRSLPISRQGIALPVVFNSLLTTYIPGLLSGSGLSYSADSCSKRVYHLNNYLPSLYQSASEEHIGNRFLIQVKDSTPFFKNEDPEWSRHNSFCYELTVPASTSATDQKEIMMEDLNRYFNYTARWEKRNVNCWILIRTGAAERLFAKAPKPGSRFRPNEVAIYSRPVSFLVKALNSYQPGSYPMPIVIDETCITEPVSLHLNASLTDFEALRCELNQYELDLVPAVRELDIFVIADKE